MTDRINAWLDGDLPFEALEPRERTQARALQATIGAAAARLARAPAPDLTGRVMAALPAEPVPSVSVGETAPARLGAWLQSFVPRSEAFRPAMVLAAAALAIGFGLGRIAPVQGPTDGATGFAQETAEVQLFVRFELEATGAADVRLAGSFTDWEASYQLTPLGDDRWSVTVPLEPGVHDYMFVLDGERHVMDPYAPRVSDGFGGYSSRLALLTPST